MISVIVRTRDEEQLLHRCLRAVQLQEHVCTEIVVVDNDSTDATVEIARSLGVTVVAIGRDEFSYGRALNRGIERCSGELICCLSGHCVPENPNWLFWLATNFWEPDVAGVYGRQMPVQSTHALDKRDLWTLFGPERRIQTQDPFFHNANSMIRRSMWESVPFDEEISGLEDRIWARRIQSLGYKVVYEPRGGVYHPHGINQTADPVRAERVVRVMEQNGLHRF